MFILGPDIIYARSYINKIKNQEETDNSSIYERSKMKRLVLYHVGISSFPLTARHIEKNISPKYSGTRPNYVYELLQKLAPESNVFPQTLLLKLNDFFEKGKDKGIKSLSDEEKDKLIRKIKLKIFHSYGLYLGCNKVDDLAINIQKWDTKRISIKIKSEDKSMIILLKPDTSILNDTVKLYLNDIEVPLLSIRKKGSVHYYTIENYSVVKFRCYLDRIFFKCSLGNMFNDELSNNHRNKPFIKDKEFGYVLNLRGLMQFILLCKKKKLPYDEINKVIENLAKIDNYWKLKNEFDQKHNTNFSTDNSTNFIVHDLGNYSVKERFPFLSFYNVYREHLPRNYAANILIEIAESFASNLETMNISELKYEATNIFFRKIEDYFWESFGLSRPKIEDNKLIPDSIYNVLKEYQNEIRYYMSQIKYAELRNFIKQGEDYEEYNSRRDLKEKILKYLYKNQKAVIWIKDVLYTNDPDSMPIGLTGTELGVIEDICESSGLDYVTNKGSFLFKKTEIEKIKGCLESNMTLETAKKLVLKHGINNETAIRDVIVLCGFKTKRIGTGPRVIIKKSD